LEIDSKLKFWLYSLPPEWMPQTFQISDDSETCSVSYASHYDVYPGPSIASLWGTYYSDRIMIHEQLLGLYEKTSSAPYCEARENFNNSVNILQTRTEKICHSIPLCFRFSDYADMSTGPLRKRNRPPLHMGCAPRGKVMGCRTKTTCLDRDASEKNRDLFRIKAGSHPIGYSSRKKRRSPSFGYVLSQFLVGLWVSRAETRRLQFLANAPGSYVGKSKMLFRDVLSHVSEILGLGSTAWSNPRQLVGH
jgi:hypothetical protein